MEFRGLMGGFYRLSEWIMRFTVTNLLWLLCSAPFFFFLFTKLVMMANNFPNESLQMSWAMGISAPFLLFPATAAMFSVARKWVMGDTDVKLLKTFFKSYKENYKQAMIGGIFYTLLIVIMYVDYTVYMTQFESLQIVGWVMLGLLIMLFISMFNFFSMVAHYHMKSFQILKNSILITIFSPLRVILTTIVSVGLLYIGVRYPVVLIFFAGAVIAYYAFFNFYATYQKMQDKHEKYKAAEAEEKAAQEADELNLDNDGEVKQAD
ncbi:YesL family protein [Paenibacillus marinisediminis]